MARNNFRHYRVFYLPVRGPYGPIMASSRRKRQSVQAGEFFMNFNGTTGTLTNLNGSVTYSIQVAAVTIFNEQEVIGDRSAAIEMTTSTGGKQMFTARHFCINDNCVTIEPADPEILSSVISRRNGRFNITLTWSRPDPPNGIITQYNVSNNKY